MIAKQMDIRSNIKKYFDMAYDGEVIIVPRKHDHNVVIISEEEFNRLNHSNRINTYVNSIANSPSIKSSAKTAASGEVKKHNLEKLEIIRFLEDNWNGNGAPAFSKKVMDKAVKLIDKLIIQPEIFPTALGNIQLEYDNSRRDHMEIEISNEDTAEIFIVMFNGEEIEETIKATADSINKRVGEFYG